MTKQIIAALALAFGTTVAVAAEQGRNWGDVDKDKNNLVSAEEMEAWLKANPGPLAGSAGKEAPPSKEAPADKEKKQ